MNLFLMMGIALAHKPSFGPYSTMDDAFSVADPNISIVVYQEISCDEHQIWLSFEAEEGFPLYVQGGIPEIDRLESYKPHIAVIASGLPEVEQELPFDIPEHMGVIVYSPEDEATDFYEPFTQTSSWVWIEETLTLPETSRGYVVAWHEGNQTGKMWVATGVVEDFSDVDTSDFVMWNEYVNNFHETGRFEQPLPQEEEVCLEEIDEVANKSGCGGNGSALFLLPLLGFRRRKE